MPRDAPGFWNNDKTVHFGHGVQKIVEVVRIRETGYDKLAVQVFENGKSLNKELIRAGLAWWYSWRTSNESALAQLEAVARENRTGLWSQPIPVHRGNSGDSPIEPPV